MSIRASVRAAALALAALALAACAAIPTEGPVNEGSGVVATAAPFVPIAVGPRPGDGPEAIVSGFVKASAAGFSSDFSVAREYLVGPAVTTWDPYKLVTVFDSGALTPEYTEETAVVTYDVPVSSSLDESGRMAEASDGTRQTLEFTMAQDPDGEWRIAELEDGTILASATFDRLFLDVGLTFATIDESTEVPEQRWLPITKAPTLAARELVEGPSPWLAPAVHTGFPSASGLAVDSVVVTDGIAAVQLTPESAGTPDERSLGEQQLRQTLKQIPGIEDVEVTVGGVPLGGDGSAALQPEPLPGANAAALVDGRLGVWDGENLWATGDDVGHVPAGSRGVTQGYGAPVVAWVVDGSRIVVSDALRGGTASLQPHNVDAEAPEAQMEVTTVFTGSRLVDPSFDRHGWIWTSESNDPSALSAFTTSGGSASLDVPWLRGSSVEGIAVSRDGARIAVLSRSGGEQLLQVAGVVRGSDGTPLTLGEPLAVGADLGTAFDLVWVGSGQVGVLGDAEEDVANPLWVVEVGGLTTATTAVRDSVAITARQGERSLLVTDGAAALFARSGSVWSQVAAGPTEVAYSG